MPAWMRVFVPVAIVAGAIRQPPGRRSAAVVMGITFLFMLNREPFGSTLLVHLLVWTGATYLIWVGTRGRGPDGLEGKKLAWSVLLVMVGFAVFYLREML
jgi:hypothetical protein